MFRSGVEGCQVWRLGARWRPPLFPWFVFVFACGLRKLGHLCDSHDSLEACRVQRCSELLVVTAFSRQAMPSTVICVQIWRKEWKTYHSTVLTSERSLGIYIYMCILVYGKGRQPYQQTVQ